jgi:translocation and assembly module TamB
MIAIKHVIRKFSKFCMWLLLGLLFALAMLGSKPGLKLLHVAAERYVPGLQISSLDGSLWQGLRLAQFQLSTKDFELAIESMSLRIDIDCALTQKICIERPTLQGVNLIVRGALPSNTATGTNQAVSAIPAQLTPAETATLQATTSKLFSWPVTFSITDLVITDFSLQQPEATLNLGKIQLRQIANFPEIPSETASLSETAALNKTPALVLTDLQLSDLVLNQLKTKTKTTTPDPKAIISQISAVKLPFEMLINSASLKNFQVKQDKTLIWHSNLLQVSANFNTQVWQLQQLQLDNKLPKFSLVNSTSFEPINTALAAKLQLQMADHQLALTLTGPLQALTINGELQAIAPSLNSQTIVLKAQLDLSLLRYDATIQADNLDGYVAKLLATDNGERPTVEANNTNATATNPIATKDTIPTTIATTSVNSKVATLRSVKFAISGDSKQATLQGHALLKWPTLPATELNLQTAWDFAKQQLTITQLDVLTLNGTINGLGQYDAQKQQLDLKLTLAQLLPGLFWVDYPGTINGKLNLSFIQKPQLGVRFTDIQINGELRDRPLSVIGDLELLEMPPVKVNKKSTKPLKAAKAPANNDFDIVSLSEHWQLSSQNFMLAHGPNYLKLNGELAQKWQMAVELAITDLSYSLALSEGQIQGNFLVSGDAKNPVLSGKLTAKQLSYLDDYALADLQIDGNLVQWGQQESRLTVVASQGQSPDYQLQKFEWRADGTLAQHQSILLVDSHQLQLATTYKGAWTGQIWRANIDETRFKSDIGDWQLQAPLQLELDTRKQQLTVGDSCWQNLPATVCLKAAPKLSQQAGALALKLTQLDLNALDPVFPSQLSLNGRVDGSTNLSWENGKLAVLDYELSGNTGTVKWQTHTLLEVPWQQIQVQGKLDGKTLTSQLLLQLDAQSQFNLELGLSDLDKATPQINAKVKLDPYNLKFLQPLMNEWTQFNGSAAVNLALVGAMTNPDIRGKIQLEQLLMSGKQAPIELQPSNVTVEFLGYQSLLDGTLITPDGDLKISGQSSWRDMNSWSARLDVQSPLLKLHLMDAELTMSPDLSFTANPLGGQIRGLIKVPQANLQFDSLPENAIRVSDDEVIINADLTKPAKSDWQLTSDVKLQLGNKVRLAAFGLKTRLEGELRLRQSGLTPTIHGTVHLKDGNFRAYGQDLQLRKGRLIFNGQADQPMLAIEAIRNPEKTEDDVIAGLRVNGIADNPVVEVFSEPGKPQANALAYLLLGRDIGTSAGDGSVTAGLIGIGIANSGRLVGKLGEAFGVSDLSLDTAGSGDKSKVTISGYLSPKLQIKYGVGIFNQLGEFTLRYRLMKQLYVEGVTGVANSVDLLYKMEFN